MHKVMHAVGDAVKIVNTTGMNADMWNIYVGKYAGRVGVIKKISVHDSVKVQLGDEQVWVVSKYAVPCDTMGCGDALDRLGGQQDA